MQGGYYANIKVGSAQKENMYLTMATLFKTNKTKQNKTTIRRGVPCLVFGYLRLLPNPLRVDS